MSKVVWTSAGRSFQSFGAQGNIREQAWSITTRGSRRGCLVEEDHGMTEDQGVEELVGEQEDCGDYSGFESSSGYVLHK